jgi:putative Ca2+/H+ antiporter (TMEM165/GDT1 family)
MDPKLILTTFGLIFLAELGDKTQLATLAFSAESNSPWSAFIGASLALVTTSFIAAFLGSTIAKWLPITVIHRVSGVLFLLLGILLIIKK